MAQVELSENVIAELLTTGKTGKKITGFVSKAGKQFDTCLKYENDAISFDFENPGEPQEPTTTQKERSAEAQVNGYSATN